MTRPAQTNRRPPDQGRIQAIYAFIVKYMTTRRGLPPTTNEIAREFELSKSMVHFYLKHLERQNRIRFTEFGTSRNYYLPGAIWTPPQT